MNGVTRTARRWGLVIGGLLAAVLAALLVADPALAQTVTLDLDDASGDATGRMIQLMALLTVLSLAPGILMTVTSFIRITIVLSFLRTAMGTQQSPPNVVLISMALFLTGFIMAPVLEQAWKDGLSPLIEGDITEAQAFTRTVEPFRQFMFAHVRQKDLELFVEMAALEPAPQTTDDVPTHVLVPAFMISELRRAFEIGFLLFVPFLIIDMVTASVLMSMGMMMLPPVMISIPFKLIFFVLVDGWYLVVGSLVRSFNLS